MGSLKTFAGIASIAAVLVLAPRCVAQDETSTWQCLPEETVAALRIPNGQAVLDALRETKFGAVMFTEKRKAAMLEVCEKHAQEDWEEFEAVLQQYDVSVEEIVGLLAGETGYAVAMAKDSNEEAIFFGLGWLQPGEELAEKCFKIIGEVIEQQDVEQPIARVDLELAGNAVMQLRMPSVDVEYTSEFDLPDNYDDLTEEEQTEAWERADQQHEASAVKTITYRTLLLCQLGGRLLIGHQFVAPNEDETEDADERLSSIFARLLTAHSDGGADGFATRLSSDESVARTMSADGVPVFELLVDFQPLIQAGREKAEDQVDVDRWIRLFGIEELGPFAVRQTAAGANWRTLVSLTLPAPRAGLMKLLDQEMLEVDPPQWVPASAVRYFQFGFDLGQAYETIKEEVTREFPDQTASGFTMAETQVQNFAQTSLPELLSSLGNQHTVMSFGVQAIDLESAVDDGDLDSNMTDRMAVVWQVTDEAVWSRLLKTIAPFAGMAPGTEATEEQGFTGYRMKSEQIEGGLFLGKGYLVLGVGEGVVETTLSALNNPPSGSNALRGSDLFSRAGDLVALDPSMFVEITDNERYLRMVMSQLNQQFDQLETMLSAFDEDGDDEGVWFFDLMRAMMPSDEELPGLMGVSVGRTEVNDDGIVGESSQEMPAP